MEHIKLCIRYKFSKRIIGMKKQIFFVLLVIGMVNGVFADSIQDSTPPCKQEGDASVIQFTGDASECPDDHQIHINEDVYQNIDKIYIKYGIYRTHLGTQRKKQDDSIVEKCDKVILGLEKISLGLESLSLQIQKCADKEKEKFNDLRDLMGQIGKVVKSHDIKVKANLNARMTSRAYAARKKAEADKK